MPFPATAEKRGPHLSAGISIREFARRDGCSDKIVRRAINTGHLGTLADGTLDPALVGGPWRKGNRRADTGADSAPSVRTRVRTQRSAPQPVDERLEGQPHGGALKRRRRPDEEDELEDLVDGEALMERLRRGDVLDLVTAERMKASGLALRQMVNARKLADALVEVETAERVLFEESRRVRDALLGLGAKVGPLMAADLGVEPDQVVELVNAHVHQLLAELGEPEADFTG